ncbi:MAG: aldo/keto reductase [Thermoplasmata archaeon]|nr:aldo/keto reductase [Thermoplasmata archaeon]
MPAEHFRAAGDGLELSSLGLGTYLGAADGPTDLAVSEAGAIALQSGRVNVLDTAINYRNQRAERSLGRAIVRALAGGVARDEFFLASKAGYLAPDGESPLSPQAWVRSELFDRKILRPSELVDGSHAMTPMYLRDQVGRSRANLGLECLDLLYLHNAPEAQLPWLGLEKFLERLSASFGELERLRGEGWIGSYGLATWDSLRSPRSEDSHFELEAAVAVAREAGGAGHGFRFLQFPFNAAMPEAAAVRSQRVGGTARTVFQAATALRLHCFTSVPLLQGQLLDRVPQEEGLTAAQWSLQFARSAPGTTAALVGMKDPEHLAENLTVAVRPPWPEPEFRKRLVEVAGAGASGASS